MNPTRTAASTRRHLAQATQTLERLATPSKTIAALGVLVALGAQGCAMQPLPSNCDSLSRSAVQRLEVEIESSAAVSPEHLELCVQADNYDACDTLEQTDASNTYAVSYEDHLEHVVSVAVRVRAKEPSLASAVSHVVMEEDGRTIRVSAEGEQVQPVGSAIDLEALEDVAVVAVTDDGRELVFAVAPNKGRELQFAMGPDGSSDHEVANCQ